MKIIYDNKIKKGNKEENDKRRLACGIYSQIHCRREKVV